MRRVTPLRSCEHDPVALTGPLELGQSRTGRSQPNVGLVRCRPAAGMGRTDLIDPVAGSGRTPPRPDSVPGPPDAKELAPSSFVRARPGRLGARLGRPPV